MDKKETAWSLRPRIHIVIDLFNSVLANPNTMSSRGAFTGKKKVAITWAIDETMGKKKCLLKGRSRQKHTGGDCLQFLLRKGERRRPRTDIQIGRNGLVLVLGGNQSAFILRIYKDLITPHLHRTQNQVIQLSSWSRLELFPLPGNNCSFRQQSYYAQL